MATKQAKMVIPGLVESRYGKTFYDREKDPFIIKQKARRVESYRRQVAERGRIVRWYPQVNINDTAGD